MKCRAKMIDGTPVTFEMIDCGVMYELDGGRDGYISNPAEAARWKTSRKVLLTDFWGEGFWVRCVSPHPGGPDLRRALERSHLERAGVDTATVEYIAGYIEHGKFARGVPSDLRPCWVPMFPPVPKHPLPPLGPLGPLYRNKGTISWKEGWGEPGAMPGRITYVGAEHLVTEAMLDAGLSAMGKSHLYGEPYKTVEMIWRAMEKARKKS